ncbi:MAG: hypothetical protein HFI93_02215 [Lachnospiraceae bacterium]|nr:hypothetical protein [Lachnospiraceae bacterium]
MATNKRPFTLRLDEELYAEIGKLSVEDNRSMTNYIEHILQLHIKEIEKQRKLTDASGKNLPPC